MKKIKDTLVEIIQSRSDETEVLISVYKWLINEPVTNQYIEHPRSFWLLWNYYKRIGFKKVITKLKSRFYEKDRNKKVAGFFIGHILESSNNSDLSKGMSVLCFATNHIPHSKIQVLNEDFIISLDNQKKHSKLTNSYSLSSELKMFIPWTKFSGVKIDKSALKSAIKNFRDSFFIESPEKESNIRLYADSIERPKNNSNKPTAVLFGLGNYAKTSIIPNIKRNIKLQRVHEVDTDQLKFLSKSHDISVDTSHIPRKDLSFDVWFIAGFHHTHSDLAIAALKQGACAVIEKPLVTTFKQYEAFREQINKSEESCFYACFHKRYSELHKLFLEDIGDDKDHPIDMHCIVYEIPLPIHHWYNWPNSGSRLISNGCHWLDYFMFLNDYSEVVDIKKWIPRGDDMVVQVKLENDAYFSMSLTDTGSQRIGVRDYIELRAAGKTFTMMDGEKYTAENRNHIYRKTRVNPLSAYSRMYSKISHDIANKKGGDNKITLRSTKLMLDLESLS